MAGAEAGQEVIADRAAEGGELVDADGRAEELDRIAWADCALGQVGDVADGEVHRPPSDQRRPAPGDRDFRARLHIRRAGAARQAVGVADEEGREARRAPGGPLGIVAAGRAGLDPTDLLDGYWESHDRTHRVWAARRRIAAVEGIARTAQVVDRGA